MRDATVASAPKHRTAIFLASFLTLIAAGMGFAIRGGILGDWSAQYGFTRFELGTITGGGLVGFGAVILAASLITDRLGYKTILLAGFLCHVVSAAITLAATPIYNASGKDATYWCLYIGMFLFSIGNGLCEAVINPLVATLYPTRKTHYLNILHAGWPAGLVIGALLAKFFVGPGASAQQLRWEIPMCFFLIPTLIYGFITIKEHFPISEARAAGVTFGRMLAEFASPILLLLLLLQACVGYVELGTDSWISTITDEIVKGQGLYLFIWASSVMFVLRFFAGPIVEKINPLGLLCISAVLGCIGLLLIGTIEIGTEGTVMATWAAVTIYALGKTFYWPTMLGVVGERFPRGGALTMGAVGGIGMLSAGLLGGPGIGFKQDYFASQKLRELSPQAYQRYQAPADNNFLTFETRGLDGAKVGVVRDAKGPGTELAATVDLLEQKNLKNAEIDTLNQWWQTEAEPTAETDANAVNEAVLFGGQRALLYTAAVPAFMAFGYLLLVIYFRMKGGYKQEHIGGEDPVVKDHGEEYTGGVPAPVR
ncbi:MAG: MFS transporter [Planctomycetaceae bacterium]|nr:MFS transporter [Planctomycetaceae bacterium]